MSNENETLRWPANLDHDAIVQRLVQVRESAQAAGIEELAVRFVDIETVPAGQLGAKVISALTWIQDRPECQAYATQLGIVAMNLKNLK
jgi:hypothetical protein